MTIIQTNRAAFVLLAVLLAACGPKRPPAQVTPDDLFRRGMTEHAEGRHRRAAETLQRFISENGGDPRVPQALLTLGRSHLGTREYVTAVADFLRLVNDFPTDPLARDARMGMCQGYARLAPEPALDQEYTRAALAYCESFAQIYPGTEDAARANEIVADMEGRLARKAFDNGMYYFKRKAYDAALIYFQETVRDHARTPHAPAALKMMIDTYTRIGYTEEATEARARLLRDYPNSPEAKSLPG